MGMEEMVIVERIRDWKARKNDPDRGSRPAFSDKERMLYSMDAMLKAIRTAVDQGIITEDEVQELDAGGRAG